MAFRFSDNILNNFEGTGFVVRNRVPRTLFIVIIFLAAFDLICFTAYLTNDTSVNAIFLTVLLLSISALCGLTFYFINRFRRLILVTEFQTAMLASAAQIGTRFCFIVNTEGMIFYVDPGFQKTFPAFMDSGDRTLWELLAFMETPADLTQKVLNSLKGGKSDHIILSFKDRENLPVTAVMNIDVITRPRGYFIIRGRNYIEKRSEVKSNEGNQDLQYVAQTLAHAVSTLPQWLLVADSVGRIVSINETFEQWLGYGYGEIAAAKLPIRQIFHQYGHNDTGVMLLEDYQGEVVLRKKDLTLLAARLHQKVLMAAGKTLGISATVDLQQP
ncbi:MAG TPA: PAS domain-containing protein [Rickettsiales bacterium]|nr:PAS domain-containing protein [Rickettsiales bacterium]